MIQKGRQLSYRDARELAEQSAKVAHLPWSGRFTEVADSLVQTRPERQAEVFNQYENALGSFVGRIMPSGPSGQADYTDSRYWVVEVSENSTDGVSSSSRPSFYNAPTTSKGFRWVTAVNLAEFKQNGASTETHSQKATGTDVLLWPIVHVFYSKSSDGQPRFFFRRKSMVSVVPIESRFWWVSSVYSGIDTPPALGGTKPSDAFLNEQQYPYDYAPWPFDVDPHWLLPFDRVLGIGGNAQNIVVCGTGAKPPLNPSTNIIFSKYPFVNQSSNYIIAADQWSLGSTTGVSNPFDPQFVELFGCGGGFEEQTELGLLRIAWVVYRTNVNSLRVIPIELNRRASFFARDLSFGLPSGVYVDCGGTTTKFVYGWKDTIYEFDAFFSSNGTWNIGNPYSINAHETYPTQFTGIGCDGFAVVWRSWQETNQKSIVRCKKLRDSEFYQLLDSHNNYAPNGSSKGCGG